MAAPGPSRTQVIRYWGSKCWICWRPIDLSLRFPDPDAYTRDHVIPQSMSGGHHIRNVRPAHNRCNTRRGNQYRPPGRGTLRII